MTISKFLSRLTRGKTTSDHELPVCQPKSTPYLPINTSAQFSQLQESSSGFAHDATINTSDIVSNKEAWLQVLITHIVLMNSFGLIQSFGIFQLSYESLLHKSPSIIAWIGSVHIFFVYFLGTFSGWALDRGYYKRLLCIGSILQIIGLLGAGFSKTYWMTLISHGVIQGVGNGMMFCPAVTTTAVYIKDSKSKTLALATAGCGASTGGMLFSLIAKYTIDELGIHYTLWVLCGAVTLLSGIVQVLAYMGLKHTHKPSLAKTRTASHIIDWRALTSLPYALYVLAMFLVFIGLWIPFFYIRPLTSVSRYPTLSPSPSPISLLLPLNASGIPGRIIPALLADRCIGTINTYITVLLLTSTTLLCWPFVHTPSSMLSWAIAYGFGAGGVGSLVQAGVVALSQEKEEDGKTGMGGRIGMVCSVVGIASLLGGPVGGELARIGGGEGRDGFVWMMVFTGVIMVLGCGILGIAREIKTGRRLVVRI